jgi:CheY-like chemotaxis protein
MKPELLKLEGFLFPSAPRVLLVDDDPLFSGILSRLAISGNIRLEHVASPREVELATLRATYDLIITDYDLPNITGVQMIRSLELCRQDLPTVLITSFDEIPEKPLPSSVLLSMHKWEGPQRILYSSLTAFHQAHV